MKTRKNKCPKCGVRYRKANGEHKDYRTKHHLYPQRYGQSSETVGICRGCHTLLEEAIRFTERVARRRGERLPFPKAKYIELFDMFIS